LISRDNFLFSLFISGLFFYHKLLRKYLSNLNQEEIQFDLWLNEWEINNTDDFLVNFCEEKFLLPSCLNSAKTRIYISVCHFSK